MGVPWWVGTFRYTWAQVEPALLRSKPRCDQALCNGA